MLLIFEELAQSHGLGELHHHVDEPLQAEQEVNSANISRSFAVPPGDNDPPGTRRLIRFGDGKLQFWIKNVLGSPSAERWLPLGPVINPGVGNRDNGTDSAGTSICHAEYSGCNGGTKEFLITYNHTGGPTFFDVIVERKSGSYWYQLFVSPLACTPAQFSSTQQVRVFGVNDVGFSNYCNLTVPGGRNCGNEEPW